MNLNDAVWVARNVPHIGTRHGRIEWIRADGRMLVRFKLEELPRGLRRHGGVFLLKRSELFQL